VPGVFKGPTEAEWQANIHHRTTQMFPQLVTGRYIRLVVESHAASMVALRAGLLMHTHKKNMMVGRHQFRRCLESDRYMKLVKVGKLTWAASQALNQSAPQDITKSVDCPGCYQCREVPIAPNTGQGTMYHVRDPTPSLHCGMGNKSTLCACSPLRRHKLTRSQAKLVNSRSEPSTQN